jgi:hypothetical protein
MTRLAHVREHRLSLEWIDVANTEYRYTAIRIPVNTGIFNVFFLSQTELLTVEKNQVFTKYWHVVKHGLDSLVKHGQLIKLE